LSQFSEKKVWVIHHKKALFALKDTDHLVTPCINGAKKFYFLTKLSFLSVKHNIRNTMNETPFLINCWYLSYSLVKRALLARCFCTCSACVLVMHAPARAVIITSFFKQDDVAGVTQSVFFFVKNWLRHST
jgi:hypothetical protein